MLWLLRSQANKDHPLSIYHLPPHQFLSERNSVSWTASCVRYLVYVVVGHAPVADAPSARKKGDNAEEMQRQAEVWAAWQSESEVCARMAINPEGEPFCCILLAHASSSVGACTPRRHGGESSEEDKVRVLWLCWC